MPIRFTFVMFLLLMGIVPTVFTLGPQIESKINPVVKVTFENISYGVVEESRKPIVYFSLHADKKRPCPLQSLSFSWIFNSSIETAAVFVLDSGLPFKAPTVLSVAEYDTPVLWTEIPLAAYGHEYAALVGTGSHDCHKLWPISFESRAVIVLPTYETPAIERATK